VVDRGLRQRRGDHRRQHRLPDRQKGRNPTVHLGRPKVPKHFGPGHVAKAKEFFDRYGMWAVFFGRFVALLRILSGPLAGCLHMRYSRFLIANTLGGIVWAGGTTFVVYTLGVIAEKWLSRFSWIGLAVAVLTGLVVTFVIKRRIARSIDHDSEPELTTINS
jgi:membrane protein DedA with SNARE-associated domain